MLISRETQARDSGSAPTARVLAGLLNSGWWINAHHFAHPVRAGSDASPDRFCHGPRAQHKRGYVVVLRVTPGR
jgi:hypothetical protein